MTGKFQESIYGAFFNSSKKLSGGGKYIRCDIVSGNINFFRFRHMRTYAINEKKYRENYLFYDAL